jgi:hypothetical protein
MKLFGHSVDGKPLQAVAVAAKKGASAAAARVVQAVAGIRPKPRDKDAEAELRRRAEVNAHGAAMREEIEASIFGDGARWLPRRSHWLERRR